MGSQLHPTYSNMSHWARSTAAALRLSAYRRSSHTPDDLIGVVARERLERVRVAVDASPSGPGEDRRELRRDAINVHEDVWAELAEDMIRGV